MFVQVSGFGDGVGLRLPRHMRNPPNNTRTVVLALVRWLSPHPDAILRDDQHRPMCPTPFDMNHALWEFSREPRRRDAFQHRHHRRQLHLFPGSDEATRRDNADRLAWARHDLIQLESIESFMNYTTVDKDDSCILETIILPF